MDHRSLQRMRDGANQFASGVARQLCIGVQRDHVLDTAQLFLVAGYRRKVVGLSQQQIIQIQQFAALALPTHPNLFDGIESTIPVKQEKCAFAIARVAPLAAETTQPPGMLARALPLRPPPRSKGRPSATQCRVDTSRQASASQVSLRRRKTRL